jgi:hypothetical protein
VVKFLWREVVTTSPNPQAGGPPLVGCPRLLVQYIRSYPPYVEAVPPFATWGRAMPLWQGPTYHCDWDPLITVTVTHLSLWQGPTYHCDRDLPITVIRTHLSLWLGPTCHGDWDPLITVTGTHLSLWLGPTYHCDRDPLITGAYWTKDVMQLTACLLTTWNNICSCAGGLGCPSLAIVVCCVDTDLSDKPIACPGESHRIYVSLCVITCNNYPFRPTLE